MMFLVESASETGNFRSNNEDAIEWGYLEGQDSVWMVVADGMGGHQAGEVASLLLTEHVKQAAKKFTGSAVNSIEDWITQTLEEANIKIWQQGRRNSEQRGMGTTGVLLVCCSQNVTQRQTKEPADLLGGNYYVGWVGDSRAYIYRSLKDTPHAQGNTELHQITKDHTAIQQLLDKGAITEQQARDSNTKHILARAIGIGELVLTDVVSGQFYKDDIFMLSTDGLHDSIREADVNWLFNQMQKTAEQIGEPINESIGLTILGQHLIERAIANGSKDNISIGLIKQVES